LSERYRSKSCVKCVCYWDFWNYPDNEGKINPPDTCTYCRRFYDDYFVEKGEDEN